MQDLLEKFEIAFEEKRRRFWDEIKVFASEEDRSRNEGKHSEIRSYPCDLGAINYPKLNETYHATSMSEWKNLY